MASPQIQAIPPTPPHTVTKSPLQGPPGTGPAQSGPIANPLPHIRSMLDVGPGPTPKPKTLTASDPTNPPTTDAFLQPTPPNSKPNTRPRPVSTSDLASMTTAAMSADVPRSAPRAMPSRKPPPLERMNSANKDASSKNNGTATPPSPTKQRGLGRVRSFLQRRTSAGHQITRSDGAEDVSKPSEPATSRPGLKVSNTFTFSSHSSATSRSGTPPSPGSPASTINETEAESLPEEESLTKHQSYSQSYSNLRNSGIRVGITWGPNIGGGRARDEPRRRSVSTEHVPTIKTPNAMSNIAEEDEPRFRLHHAFSRDAGEGAGLKARRLSACLPDEFWVDYCELDDEFKSSTIVPGRRGKLLGKGATSTVRMMCRKGELSGRFYAVKEFRGKEREEKEEDYVKKVKSEFSIAKSLHHPNVVETVRLCIHNSKWNHVMEYCQHGELYSLVEKGLFKNGTFKQADKLCFFKQTIRGVDYLHSHGIAHRDIKLENLLLTGDGFLKITDFGVSEVFSGEHPGLRSAGGECGKNMGKTRRCAPGICGSLPYIAPEVLEKKGEYDPRPLDVWSCAIVYLTMTFGGSPWAAAKTDGNPYYAKFKAGWDAWMDKNPSGEISDSPGSAPSCGPMFSPQWLGSPAIKRLMLKMLHPVPEKRVSIHDVLVSATVRGIECCSPESSDDSVCCAVIDASKSGKCRGVDGKKAVKRVKHSHTPPREHKTPKLLQHRFDMGDGYS